MIPTIRLDVTLLTTALLCSAPGLYAQNNDALPLSETALRSRFERALDSLTNAGQFSGAVLFMKGDKAVYQRAAARGMADREAGRPNRVETAFNLGSITRSSPRPRSGSSQPRESWISIPHSPGTGRTTPIPMSPGR